jgi:hypothetical protein
MALPEIVSREQWLEARVRLLAEEKAETRRRDALNTRRRMLPMVAMDKEYVFDGPGGPVALAGLFGGSRQLIIHHVMFGPDWDAACPVCTSFIDELSDGLLAHLRDRWTTTTGPRCRCSTSAGPASRPAPAASCATARRCSTPTRPSAGAMSTPRACTHCSTSPRSAGRKPGRSPAGAPRLSTGTERTSAYAGGRRPRAKGGLQADGRRPEAP